MSEMTANGCPTLEQLTQLFENRISGSAARQLESHLASCVACRAEWDMLAEFAAAQPEPHEQADVAAITADLRRARRTQRTGWFSLAMMPKWAGAFAALLLLVAVGLKWQSSRRSTLEDFEPSGNVRAGQTIRVSPGGDLSKVPAEFTWQAVPNAARYQVSFQEVDETPLWQGQTAAPPVATPAPVRAAMLPLKTLVCRVEAFDASGNRIAQADPVRFRLVPPKTP